MIKLDKKQLRKLQMLELELLVEVDRICKKCDIKYNIIAGTLLGAVRHKGFIPWDDDADVAMLRDEYEKFRKACESELDRSKYYFQDYRNTSGYRWGYGKLRCKETLFLREYQEHMPYDQGVFIDIFPMDYVPSGHILSKVHNFKCYVVRKILWSEVGKYAHKNRMIRIVYRALSRIPESSAKSILKRLEKKSYENPTPYVRMLMFPNPNKKMSYNIDWYLSREIYTFEGKSFYGAKDYDGYLKHCYGEYKVLPPVDKRKIHPVSRISLERGK